MKRAEETGPILRDGAWGERLGRVVKFHPQGWLRGDTTKEETIQGEEKTERHLRIR
jgi:hypothetical protein